MIDAFTWLSGVSFVWIGDMIKQSGLIVHDAPSRMIACLLVFSYSAFSSSLSKFHRWSVRISKIFGLFRETHKIVFFRPHVSFFAPSLDPLTELHYLVPSRPRVGTYHFCCFLDLGRVAGLRINFVRSSVFSSCCFSFGRSLAPVVRLRSGLEILLKATTGARLLPVHAQSISGLNCHLSHPTNFSIHPPSKQEFIHLLDKHCECERKQNFLYIKEFLKKSKLRNCSWRTVLKTADDSSCMFEEDIASLGSETFLLNHIWSINLFTSRNFLVI